MAQGLNDLIEFVLDEIALCGPPGTSSHRRRISPLSLRYRDLRMVFIQGEHVMRGPACSQTPQTPFCWLRSTFGEGDVRVSAVTALFAFPTTNSLQELAPQNSAAPSRSSTIIVIPMNKSKPSSIFQFRTAAFKRPSGTGSSVTWTFRLCTRTSRTNPFHSPNSRRLNSVRLGSRSTKLPKPVQELCSENLPLLQFNLVFGSTYARRSKMSLTMQAATIDFY
jgi:hypothetical protein